MMKFTRTLRIFGLAIVFILLVAALPVAPALAATYNVDIDIDEGPIGTEVTVIGDDFGYSVDTDRFVTIYFSDEEADKGDDIDVEVENYEVVSGSVDVESDDDGSFEETFTIPDALTDGEEDVEVTNGDYYIYFTLTSETATEVSTYIREVVEFTVIGGAIEIDPEEGPVDTLVEITGESFPDDENIEIEFDGDGIDIEDGDEDTDSDGEFSLIISIPESPAGDHTITVIVDTSEVEAEFTVEPNIDLSVQSGEAGDSITVIGTGFDKREDVEIWFNDNIGVATDTTDSDGSFDTEFIVPSGLQANIYDVVADDGTNDATAKFTLVTEPSSTTPEPSPTPTPEPPTSNTALNVSPQSGNVGSLIGVSGAGFQPGGTAIVKYGEEVVATGTVAADGTFISNIFQVPPSPHGINTITVTDGTNTGQITFTVESTAPGIPQPLRPEMGVKAKSPVTFDWEDVTDVSLPVTYTLQIATDDLFTTESVVLEKKNITESQYELLPEEEEFLAGSEEPYYWRINSVDGASNESAWTGAGEFYVSPPFNFPKWLLYTLLGIGAVVIFGLGYWLGRRTAFYY